MTATSYPTISSDRAVQSAYQRMRDEGVSHSMAEMFAVRQPPGTLNTDRAFMSGKQNGQDLDDLPAPVRRKRMKEHERLTGRGVPNGSRYLTQLARFPGDPLAWVGDVGDAKKRIREAGHGCEDFGIDRVETPPPPPVPLAEKLVKQFVKAEAAKPENIGKKAGELREMVIAKHGYKPSKKD